MTQSICNSLSEWIQPGFLVKETGEFLKKEVDSTIDAVQNVLDWFAYFGDKNAKKYSEKLEIIGDGFAIPGLIGKVGDLKTEYQRWSRSDDYPHSRIALKTLSGVKDGCKSLFFFDGISVFPLKDWMKPTSGIFWGAFVLSDTLNFFKHVGKAEKLNGEIDSIVDPKVKNTKEHRLQLVYLRVLRAVNGIALAAIALVSLFFASLAKGFIFSPVVTLGLTSSLLVLSFATYFYKKMIQNWEQNTKRLPMPQPIMGS